ncbi:RTA1 like protein-domain-containing protein [Hygrophoropsis aurantiaca]|uniref:RTA1 like protein-domain-containing protein n=1 Tax=Hygrophoropsis aurantiaca TaxID=72124 RepID=A0ACB8AIN7_9AGAM|nr:RTA1 like protein-domain-containing protein [Hygrophoropsis aurantiaca]
MATNFTSAAGGLLSRAQAFDPEVLLRGNTGIGPYDYVPTRSVGIIFTTLFAISTVAHIIQSVRFRLWWLLPTAVFCGVSELVGWSARLYSSGAPRALIPFEIQISATITGPTPLIAANFVILEYIIKTLGPRFSRLTPKMYTIIFCSCDAISLTIQGVGGAVAAMAAGNGNDPTTGGTIMLIGIVIQMVAISAFVMCAGEFLYRYATNQPLHKAEDDFEKHSSVSDYVRGMDPRMKIMLYAMTFTTTCLFIRAVYRTVELTDGWNGRIISTQVYFNVLDGGMVTLAIYTLNIFHPGFLILPIQRATKRSSSFAYIDGV